MLAVLGLAGTAVAQMPLPVFGFTYQDITTRGFWFQAPVSCVITGLSVPNEAAQANQVVEVIDLGAAPPPAYPGTINGTQLFYSNSTAAGSIIPTAIVVPAGAYIGILGACTPSVGSNTSYNSYANVAGPFASDILGIPTTITRFGTQFGIGAGGNQPCWQEPGGTLSRVDVYVAPSGGGTPGANTTIGAGCPQSFDSFYEYFPNATAASTALTGNVLMLSPNGGGYQGAWLPGAAASMYVAPVGATTLATGDDGYVAHSPSSALSTPYGPQSTLQISGNGILGFGAGALDYPGSNAYTPATPGFLNATLGGFYSWHDFNVAEAGSGALVVHEAGGTLYVTWNDVENYANPETANRSTVQFQLDLATGLVRIVWVNVDGNASSTWGSSHLIGVSGPGLSADPGAVTLSTATASQLATGQPLALAATTRPVTGTTWNLTTSAIPSNGVLGIEIFGLSDPGINDLAFLGMPGCGLRAALDSMNPYLVTGSTHSYSLTIPSNPTLVGVDVFTTSAIFQNPPTNAFGVISSNGIKGHVGDF